MADLLILLAPVVTLYRLGLNDHRGVAFLPSLASGRYRSGDVAPDPTQHHKSSDAGKPLVYVPKLCSGSKYSGQLRFPQQEVSLLPGTPLEN